MPELINNASQLDSLLNKHKRVDFIFEFPGLSSNDNEVMQKKNQEKLFCLWL